MATLVAILHGDAPDLLLDTDDRDYFAEASVAVADLSHLFSPDRRPSAMGRPVIDVVFLIGYALWETNHVFYHYQVVLAHLMASLLMALVCHRLGASFQSALLGGLFFLICVAHFRAVQWIASIGYPLSLIFGFVTILYHLHFLNGRRWGRYLGAASIGLAVLTHPSSISILPFCIYLTWRRLRSVVCTIKESGHLTVVAVGCFGLCYYLYPQAAQVETVDTAFGLESAVESMFWYLSRLITTSHWLIANLHPQPEMWELIVGGLGYVALFFLWWKGPEPVRIFAVFTALAILPFLTSKPGFRWTPAGPSRHLYFAAVGSSFILAFFLVWIKDALTAWIGQIKAVVIVGCTIVGILGLSLFNIWRTYAVSYYASGRSYFALAEIDQGMIQLQKAIDQSPTVAPPDTYVRLVKMSLSENKLPERYHRIGRAVYPDNASLIFCEGLWESQNADASTQHIGQEKIERAFKIATNEDELKFNASVACYNLAAYFANQADYLRAVSLFRQALVFNPRYLAAMINLGKTLKLAGDPNEAVRVFQQAIKLDVEREEPYDLIAAILYENSRFEEVKQVAELIRQFSPESVNAHYWLAAACKAQGSLDRAVIYYKKVLELAPSHLEAQKALRELVP